MHNLKIYALNVNEIIKNINNEKTFTFSKISIEFWMMAWRAFAQMGTDIKKLDSKQLKNKKFISLLAKNMIDVWNVKMKNGRPWKGSNLVFERILQMIMEEQLPNFMLGINEPLGKRKQDRYLYLNPQANLFLQKFLHNQTIIHDSNCWKYWAHDGTIDLFMKNLSNKNVTIIGPSHLKDFNEKVKIKKFNHIQIHDREAALHTIVYSKEIIKQHSSDDYKVYLIQGGSAAMDLCILLHDKMQNCCIIDIGRAIDVYYYYDPIRKKYPKWYWGGWLDVKPPKWLLK